MHAVVCSPQLMCLQCFDDHFKGFKWSSKRCRRINLGENHTQQNRNAMRQVKILGGYGLLQ